MENIDYEWEAVMQGRREGIERDKAREESKKGISKKEFKAYERVRESGVTNMFDVRTVERLSRLSRSKIIRIMEEYGDLMKKYPDVRKR